MLSNESKKYYKNVQDFLITLKLSFMNLNVKERQDDMRTKVLEVIRRAYYSKDCTQYNNEFNWYLLNDDDNVIFIYNLFSFTSKKRFNEPFTYG